MIRHPKQSAFHVGPSHWVVARVADRPGAGFDVIEITAQARRTHYRGCRRAHAEVLAAALAATRLHTPLTAEDHR